jgi:hypothetical protein
MKSGGPSSHAVNFQIPTADYFCKNSFSADDNTSAPLIETDVCYCIHQNIQMDPIMSQLHLISSLNLPCQTHFSVSFHVFLRLAFQLFTS